MVNIFIKIFIFIYSIVLVCSLHAGTIDVDYNFETSELLVNTVCNPGDYTLVLYKQFFIDCEEQNEAIQTITLDNHTSGIVTIEDVSIDKYKIILNGPEFLKKDIYLSLTTENMVMGWCPVESSVPLQYNIYIKDFDTGEYVSSISIVGKDATSHDFDNLSANTKYFMYITAENESVESYHSNEAIMYVVLPSNLKSLKLE